MTERERDNLLYSAMLAMRNASDYPSRYELWVICESLLGEYKDMDHADTVRRLAAHGYGAFLERGIECGQR